MSDPHAASPAAPHPAPQAAPARVDAIGIVAFVLAIVLVVFDLVGVIITASALRSSDIGAIATSSLVVSAIMVVLALTAIAVGITACLRGGPTRVYGAIGTTAGAMVLLAEFGTLLYSLIVSG
ncbi:hypothetical protein [Agromyces sp. NPDC058126]|uniref:hypothetical protein n=1 Tax=Agromyces sp. NPDC058126 TaxID=3346350 RepID=UPI0036DF827C